MTPSTPIAAFVVSGSPVVVPGSGGSPVEGTTPVVVSPELVGIPDVETDVGLGGLDCVSVEPELEELSLSVPAPSPTNGPQPTSVPNAAIPTRPESRPTTQYTQRLYAKLVSFVGFMRGSCRSPLASRRVCACSREPLDSGRWPSPACSAAETLAPERSRGPVSRRIVPRSTRHADRRRSCRRHPSGSGRAPRIPTGAESSRARSIDQP